MPNQLARPGQKHSPVSLSPVVRLKRELKMNRVTDVPNISKEMKAIYGKFMDSGDFEEALPHIDAFLGKYPNYTEALVFKAKH